MTAAAPRSFGAHLRSLREAAGFTQEELATIAGLSVNAVSALERGERRRPHVDTVRALSAALDLTPAVRDEFVASSRIAGQDAAVDELRAVSLPQPLTALVGRETDVQVLRQWLADPSARLITLLGTGGVGKSRLALDLARAVAEESSTRVAFVPLAAIRDPGLAACAIAEALGLADISASDLPRRARGACGERPTLLVLDNFEQILAAAPLVADVLSAASSLRILVTSRTPLRVRGEREYTVGPLPTTTAATLFVERAREVQRDFRANSASDSTIDEICRRLDGLPLAIELAARWIKVLSPGDLLERLWRDVLFSSNGPRDLPERQQTMTATVAWSYQLLDSQEQRAFRRLSVLPGRFPLEAAAAVLSGQSNVPVASHDVLAAVMGVIDKSLLIADDFAVNRLLYRMLETVRAYAAQQLMITGEHEDAMEGLVRYCARETALCAERLVGPEQTDWLDRVHHDLGTYRTALMWLLQRGRPAEAADIVWDLLTFWMIRGLAGEAIGWNEEILKQPSVPAGARAKTLIGLASVCYSRGELERARNEMTRGLALAQTAGELALIAPGEILLGHVHYAAGDLNGARELFTRSLDMFRAAHMPWGIGNALTGLAGVAAASGDVEQAERLLDESITVLRRAGPWYLALALYVRAVLAVRRGDADTAISFVRDCLTRVRELQDKFAFVHLMVPLAAAAAVKRNYEWAARILAAESVVTERTGAMVLDHAVRDLREHTEHQARTTLGPDRWARAYAAGRTASIDALLEDIDRSADALVE